MSPAAVAAGGFLGTLVLTTTLRAASELGLTRMDLPFLLGTALTADRARAKALGYLLHFLNGQVFAFVYFAVFAAIHHCGWWLGALFGLAQGVFAATALVNILLPIVHPRMGTPLTTAPDVALVEPPGFLMRNYGPATPLVTLTAHVAYGTLVGGFAALGG
ncbi:hypothetical protein [Streptomyces sp. NRRL B-24484]|uniref:hypothetical protein n=1 Tax=Streptomyces sp. NRRL B-24484 TaxID=1463833 RepID=UPI0004C0B45C|nr:hypothetical protein [Streptomyces sp. NRRL B-24484]